MQEIHARCATATATSSGDGDGDGDGGAAMVGRSGVHTLIREAA